MTITSVWAPLTKTVEQDDGSLIVYGKATDGSLDGDLQRCDPAWLATAMPAWYLTGGNIREQHDPHRAIGKAIDHEVDGDAHYVTARIVDPVAIAKTRAEVFTGFSIGIQRPKVDKSRPDSPGGVINGGDIVELSLCDRPSNPSCLITLAKAATPGQEVDAADYDDATHLVRCEELVDKAAGDMTITDSAAADDGTAGADTGLTVSIASTLTPEAIAALAEKVADRITGKGVSTDATSPATDPAPDSAPGPAPEVAEAGKAAGTEGDTPAVGETPGPDDPAGGDAVKVAGVANADTVGKATDIATAIVGAVIAKADDAGFTGPSDEDLAGVAIAIIARLIQSEAGDMVINPDEDGDIRCLLEAVCALRWFIRRERTEGGAGGSSDSAPYYYAATPDAEKAGTEKAGTTKTETTAVDPDTTNATVATAATTPDAAPAAEVGKTSEPDAGKAAGATQGVDADMIVKALSTALTTDDSPIRTAMTELIAASTEATVKSVSDLTERLAKVEAMPIPGGPALRATQVQQAAARKTDLTHELAKYTAKAASATDNDLQRGYAAKVASIEAELRTL